MKKFILLNFVISFFFINNYLYSNSKVFDKLNIKYSDDLVLDTDLKEFKPYVFDNGLHKSVFSNERYNILPMPKNYIEPKLQIKKINDLVGYGVFTKDFIKSGSMIKKYSGLVRICKEVEDDLLNKYIFSVSGDLIIDSKNIGNEARFFNHSYNPNSYMTFVYNDDNQDLFQCWIVALKDILPGHEIVWNYGTQYWRAVGVFPIDKTVKHVYQDSEFTIYAFCDDGVVKIFINDIEKLKIAVDKKFNISSLFSKIIKKDKNIFVMIVIKQKEENKSILLLKNANDTEFTQIVGFEKFPKIIKKDFSNFLKYLK